MDRKKEIKVFNASVTEIVKKQSTTCFNCPAQIFAKSREQVLFGTGNLCPKTMFILPHFNTRHADVIMSLYGKITNKNLLHYDYITYAIKCEKNKDFEIDDKCFNHCVFYLKYEIARLQPKNIVIFSNNENLTNQITTIAQNKTIFIIGNIGAYYVNEESRERFVHKLTKILNAIT